MSDIINRAKRLLDGATPGLWMHYEDHGIVSLASGDTAIATDLNTQDADLIAAAPELAEIVASLTTEYIAEWRDNGVWAPIEMDGFDGTFANLRAAQGYIEIAKKQAPYEVTRIVRRLVTSQEVVG